MKTFTIENETNCITLHATVESAEAVANAQGFRSEAGLARLAADWPAARLIAIWNSLPGAAPVRKFKDRATAVSRIWKAIQHLGEATLAEATQQPELVPTAEAAPVPPVAPHAPDVATEPAPARTRASRAKKPPVAATKKGIREGSKTETILGLLKRPGGASLKEIMKATEWQAHSVRGFVSGTLGKKMGLTVLSVKTGDGERSYSIHA